MKNLLLLAILSYLAIGCSTGDLDIYNTERFPTITEQEYFDTHTLPAVSFMITSYDKARNATTIVAIDDNAELRMGMLEGDQSIRVLGVNKDVMQDMKDALEPVDKQVDIKEFVNHFRSLSNVESAEVDATQEATSNEVMFMGFHYNNPEIGQTTYTIPAGTATCGGFTNQGAVTVTVETFSSVADYRAVLLDHTVDYESLFSNTSTPQLVEWLKSQRNTVRG